MPMVSTGEKNLLEQAFIPTEIVPIARNSAQMWSISIINRTVEHNIS